MALVGLQDAQILHVNSPSDFSVRLAAFDRKFFLLKERLNEFYSGNRVNLKLGSVKVGQLAAVLHDSCWSRALILATNHQNLVTIRFLDYGTTHELTVGGLYSLEDKFLDENAFAVRCHLPHLLEGVGSPWHAAATAHMKEMLDKFGPDVQIEGLQAEDTEAHGGVLKSLPVNLTWSYEEASPFGPLVKKTVNLLAKLYSMQFSCQHCEEDMNLSEEIDQLADSLTEATDLVATSDDETETKTSPTQNEKTNSNFRWPDPQIPSEERFLARCTHVDDSGQFYLQIEDTKSRIKSMNQELMSRYMGAKRSSKRVKEGGECIARWKDGKWYRGRVISYGPFGDLRSTSEDTLVLFVDFGNATLIKTKNIRSHLSFQSIPIQAVRVVLHDVKPRNGDQWSEDCLDFMYQKTNSARNWNQSPVRVAVMENNKMPLQVKIYVHSKNGIWIDLSDLLVEIGGAVYDDSFARTLEMEKRWEKESHRVGYVPPSTYRSNLDLEPAEMVEVSLPMDFPFPIQPDPLTFAKAGDTVNVKLASVLSCNRINVHPVTEDSVDVCGNVCSLNSKLHALGRQYEEMMKNLQETAPGMPPVIRPTRGLPVAAKFQVKGSQEKLWYRGIIHHVVDGKKAVIFVDFDRVLFTVESNELVELPSFCGDVPLIGMEVKLDVVAADDEEEVATVVMGECLWKQEGVLTIKFVSTSPRVAHVIDPATGNSVYSGLREDGFIIF